MASQHTTVNIKNNIYTNEVQYRIQVKSLIFQGI